MNVRGLIRRPSAFLPIAMSFLALGLVAWFVITQGVVRGEDEGAAARLFQLVMAAQLPVVAYFAFTWLPRAARPALAVLALQCVAWLAAIGSVMVLER